MILDTDYLTFSDSQIYATPVDGGGNIDAPTFTDSPAPVPPDAALSTEPVASPSSSPPTLRFSRLFPRSGANDAGTPSSGLATYSAPTSGIGVTATIASPTTTTTTKTTTSPTGGTTSGPVTSGPTSPISGSGDDLINRLIDVMAAQYAGAKAPGGGTGFGGFVSGPIDASSDGQPASGGKLTGKGMLVLALLVAGLGYWFYKSHKHKRAA